MASACAAGSTSAGEADGIAWSATGATPRLIEQRRRTPANCPLSLERLVLTLVLTYRDLIVTVNFCENFGIKEVLCNVGVPDGHYLNSAMGFRSFLMRFAQSQE
jgi:hypothetical protein